MVGLLTCVGLIRKDPGHQTQGQAERCHGTGHLCRYQAAGYRETAPHYNDHRVEAPANVGCLDGEAGSSHVELTS